MDEGHLVLDRRIRKDLEILEQLWEELATVDLTAAEIDRKDVVFVGYRLHNLLQCRRPANRSPGGRC